MRLLPRDEARSHDHLLDARRAEELYAARVILHREAIAERPRDGEAEARLRGRDTNIADGRDGEAAAHGKALDLGDDGLAHALEASGTPLALALVLDALLGGPEALELADIGAGYEGFATRPAQHEQPDGVVGVHLLGGLVEPLVHVPGHRIACFGSVGGQRHHGALAMDEDFALLRRLGCHD